METWHAAPDRRLLGRGLDRVLQHPQHFLVGFVALTLIVVAGFARFDVDTDPGLVGDGGSGFDDSLTIVFVGDHSLMTGPVLGAISGLHRSARSIDGVAGEDVISVANLIGPSLPADRRSINDLMASINADALAGVVVSPDRSVMTMVVPLNDGAHASSIRDELVGLITADAELATIQHEVSGIVLAREHIADDLFGQAIARTVLGWVLGFLVLLVVFRRPLIALAASTLIAGAMVWSFAIISAFGSTMLVPDAVLPAAILAISTGHVVRVVTAAHFHEQIREAPGRVLSDVVSSWARSSLVVDSVLIGALVALGIASSLLRSLALSLAVGLVVAWLLTATVVTAVLALLTPERYARPLTRSTGIVIVLSRSLVRAGVRFRDLLLTAVAVAIGLGAVGLATTTLSDSFLEWVPGSAPEARAADLVDTEGIGTTSTWLTIQARHPNQLISRSNIDSLDALEAAWADDDEIGESLSFWHLVTGEGPAARRRSFESIRFSHPFGTDMVDASLTTARVRVWLRNADVDATRHLLDVSSAQLERKPLGFEVEASWSGEGVDNIEWHDDVVRETAWLTLTGVGALLVTALIATRSLRWTTVAVAPAAIVFLSTMGLLGWVDGSYGLGALVAAVVGIIGVTEVGMHVSLAYRAAAKRTWSPIDAADMVGRSTARGLLVAGLTVGVSSLPLAQADLLPNGRAGVALVVAAIAGTAVALTVVIATASGPQRNTAPLPIRRAVPKGTRGLNPQ